jgi:hypothetical protein
MDTNEEREEALREAERQEALREAERVFGKTKKSGPENEIEHSEEVTEETKTRSAFSEVINDILSGDVAAPEDEELWPDDLQINGDRADLAEAMADAEDDGVISRAVIPYRAFAATFRDSDRPSVREKYVFRTQKGRKRLPLPAHLRWMQRLVEGHTSR